MNNLTFEQWLETSLGAEVYDRIIHNRHRVDLLLYQTSWQTDEDVHQDALIALMLNYQKHGFTKITAAARDEDHAASMITRYCIERSHNKYCRREKREEPIDDDKLENFFAGSHATNHDIHGTEYLDLKIDLAWAKERAIKTLQANKTLRNRSHIPHYATVLCDSHMYDANGGWGTMEQYRASQGVTRQITHRWQPRVLSELRSELVSYHQ